MISHELIELRHHLRHERGALRVAQATRKVGSRADDLGGRAHGEAPRWDGSGHERIRADDRAVADRGPRHDKHAPRQPDALAQRDRLVVDRIAVQRIEPDAVREDEAVTTDSGIVPDDDRLRRIEECQLQDDRAAAELEARLWKLRSGDVDLLANLRVFPDLNRLA